MYHLLKPTSQRATVQTSLPHHNKAILKIKSKYFIKSKKKFKEAHNLKYKLLSTYRYKVVGDIEIPSNPSVARQQATFHDNSH